MTRHKSLSCILSNMFLSVALMAVTISAAPGTWNLDADGNWDNPINWVGSTIAEGVDDTATFPNIFMADRVVTLDRSLTVGGIDFDETNNNLTLSPAVAEVLTFDVTSGTPTIAVDNSSRDLTISLTMAGNDGLTKTGAGDLWIEGANTFTGGFNIASGRVVVSNGANEASYFGDAANVMTFTGDADLHNYNGTVTFSQGIQINTGVDARMTGAFGERFQVDGALTGDGNLTLQGFSAGYDAEFRSTSNTFTGDIVIDGTSGPATMGVRSLGDAGTIGLASDGNDGGVFEYMSSANAAIVFDSRQFVLVNDGNSGSTLDRQATILSNDNLVSETVTINTSLDITGTGDKKFMLGGGNTGDNAFNGVIIDALGASTLSLYKRDGGKWILGGANTYEGDTIVDAGTLVLADSGELRFVIGDDGVNNAIVGDASNATLELDGDLVFDLTSASTTVGDSWDIVDVLNLNESYGATFGVSSLLGSFNDNSGVWTRVENGAQYEFVESTGVLSVIVIPEPASLILLGLGSMAMLGRRRK